MEVQATKYHGAFVIVDGSFEYRVWPPIQEAGGWYHPDSPRAGWRADRSKVERSDFDFAKGNDLEDVLYIFDEAVADVFRSFEGWTEFVRYEK